MRNIWKKSSVTAIITVAWFIFIILWLFFYASNYNFPQNLAIFLVSVLLAAGLNGAMWASWRKEYPEKEMTPPMEYPGWRVPLSILLAVGWLVFLILWLFFIASTFNVYQNIAIFLASVLVLGGILAAVWMSYAMRETRKRTEEKGGPTDFQI